MHSRRWHPTPVLLPGKSHGRRNLVGCSPRGRTESDTTERLHFRFSPSCIGEGNGTPLQCSCLENPRDRGAWWVAVYEVAQSQTWLKRLSSSSMCSLTWIKILPQTQSTMDSYKCWCKLMPMVCCVDASYILLDKHVVIPRSCPLSYESRWKNKTKHRPCKL